MGNPAPQTQSAQPASPHQVYKQLLQQTIREKQLQAFYPPTDSQLDQAAAVAAAHIDHVCEEWGILIEVGRDLAKLALFDIVLYIDNSGSMACNENGKRIEELRMVVSYVISVVRLFDADGFAIRFMNGMINFSYFPNGLAAA